MLSKNQIKFIKSLQQKKNIQENKLFVVEGVKMVTELLQTNFPIKQLFATSDFFRKNNIDNKIERFEIKFSELERISSLYTPNEVLAICELPDYKILWFHFCIINFKNSVPLLVNLSL